MVNLVDIGVNLMSPAFDRDREAVITRAETAGVNTLIITGSSIAGSAGALAFAQVHPHCKTTAGVHPHNAKDWDTSATARLEELISQKPAAMPAAIGECGLDYNRNFSPPQAQRKCFEDQLALAAQLEKPVFLHERDAFDDFLSILKQ